MEATLIVNKRMKENLLCPENYLYTKANVQRKFTYWKCMEFRRHGCSGHVKTLTGERTILNQPQHNHLSDIKQVWK